MKNTNLLEKLKRAQTKVLAPVLTTILFSAALHVQAAAPKCANLFADDSSVVASANDADGFYISKIRGGEITLTGSLKTKVKSILDDHGYVIQTNNLREALEGVVEILQGNNKNPSVTKSDKMARLGADLLPVLKAELNKKQAMIAQYYIAESVLRLEAIKMSEYRSENQAPDVFESPSRLKSSEFNKHVESYIDGTALYKNIGGDVGIISWDAIRSLYANNSWVIGIKDHDMYHLHYSYGHPFYLAVNFHASRSINDRRYNLISSLWESVDTFRTGLESNIADYIDKNGMTPQEGMLFLATATEAQLNKIESEIGNIDAQLAGSGSYESNYKNGWRPILIKSDRTGQQITPETYNKEIEKYLNDTLARLEKPENKRYRNYHRKGAGKTSATDEDQVAQY